MHPYFVLIAYQRVISEIKSILWLSEPIPNDDIAVTGLGTSNIMSPVLHPNHCVITAGLTSNRICFVSEGGWTKYIHNHFIIILVSINSNQGADITSKYQAKFLTRNPPELISVLSFPLFSS